MRMPFSICLTIYRGTYFLIWVFNIRVFLNFPLSLLYIFDEGHHPRKSRRKSISCYSTMRIPFFDLLNNLTEDVFSGSKENDIKYIQNSRKPVFLASEASMCKCSELFAFAHRLKPEFCLRAERACANAQSCLPLLTACKPVFPASGASMCKCSELYVVAHRL